MNVVILTGNLGSDAESRTTSNGTVITNLSVATSDRVKDGDSWKDATEWHKCVVFGKAAEFASRLKKGEKVAVEGSIRTRKWDDKDGNARTSIEIIVQKLEGLSPPAQGGQRRTQDDESIPF